MTGSGAAFSCGYAALCTSVPFAVRTNRARGLISTVEVSFVAAFTAEGAEAHKRGLRCARYRLRVETDKAGRYLLVEGAAKPGGCYSHVVLANGFAFVSGQVPKDPGTGSIPSLFADQVRLAISNVRIVLEGVGLGLSDIVKMNVYLTDPSRFAEYNAIYSEYFPSYPPARTTIGFSLPGILIEIDCIAAVPQVT